MSFTMRIAALYILSLGLFVTWLVTKKRPILLFAITSGSLALGLTALLFVLLGNM